ncbi:C1 family peptidase [Methanospirillum lacunae]|uniref:Peptidase C1A papain C-terminal domain-containing protein n=1 Tax=Methanospirillum lacunae TaxID=668570 RepID=A0A2V2MZH2_9EURY|nr:C1 family peptidase [Methanospirillum lacunae]PWR72869.1 hypothetical protein DK846_07940 [Methanospirillum lacunae]
MLEIHIQSIPTKEQIKFAIYINGPIFVGLGVWSSFDVYIGGIYSSSYTGNVNHAVELVGVGQIMGIHPGYVKTHEEPAEVKKGSLEYTRNLIISDMGLHK